MDKPAELPSGTVGRGTLKAEERQYRGRPGDRLLALRAFATRAHLLVCYGCAPVAFLLALRTSSGVCGMSMRDRPNSPKEDRGDHNERAHAILGKPAH